MKTRDALIILAMVAVLAIAAFCWGMAVADELPAQLQGRFMVRAFNGSSGVRTWTTGAVEQRHACWTFIDDDNGQRVWVSGGTVVVEALQ